MSDQQSQQSRSQKSVSSTGSRVYSVEEYRKIIYYLKQKYNGLKDENIELSDRYIQHKEQHKNNKLEYIVRYSRNILFASYRIQSLFKGFRQRKLFHRQLLRQENEDSQHQNVNQLKHDNIVFAKLCEVLEKISIYYFKTFGFTMESIFRMLDHSQQQGITSESFKMFISNPIYKKLNLSQAELNKVLFLFDEECQGDISMKVYLEILSVFGVQRESFMKISVSQLILMEICQKIKEIDRHIKSIEIYNSIRQDRDGNIYLNDFIDYLQVIGVKLFQYQIYALSQVINTDNSGKIEKQQFFQMIDLGLNNEKQFQEYQQQMQNNQQQQQQKSNNMLQIPSQQQQGQQGMDNSSFVSKNSRSKVQSHSRLDPQKEKVIEQAFDKLDSQMVAIYQFLENLLESVNLSKTSLKKKNVIDCLNKCYPDILTSTEKGTISLALNADLDDNLEVFQTVRFFTSYSKDKRSSIKLVLLLIAKRLEFDRIDSRVFLEKQSIKIDVWYSQFSFSQIISPALGMTNKQGQLLFKELDIKKEGKIRGQRIVDLLEGMRQDKQNPFSIQNRKKIQNNAVIFIQEMIAFKKALAKSNQHFNGIWIMADNQNKKAVGLTRLLEVIQEHTKLEKEQIVRWLNMIDTNRNGIIDQQEWELSTATDEEDLSAFRKQVKMLKIDKEDLLMKFSEALEKLNVTAMQFFEFNDVDGDREINLIELKNALAILDFDLDYLLQFMQLFDQNLDGTITIQEYTDILGEKYLTENQIYIKGIFQYSDEQQNGDQEEKSVQQVDDRADFSVKQRLDEYGPELKNELIDALVKLKKYCYEINPNVKISYEKLFKEFDTNLDYSLSRQEFLQGLDKHNKVLKLTERQKIRLMEAADRDKNDNIDFNEFIGLLDRISIDDKKSQSKRGQYKQKGGIIYEQQNGEDNQNKQIDLQELQENLYGIGKLNNKIWEQQEVNYDSLQFILERECVKDEEENFQRIEKNQFKAILQDNQFDNNDIIQIFHFLQQSQEQNYKEGTINYTQLLQDLEDLQKNQQERIKQKQLKQQKQQQQNGYLDYSQSSGTHSQLLDQSLDEAARFDHKQYPQNTNIA